MKWAFRKLARTRGSEVSAHRPGFTPSSEIGVISTPMSALAPRRSWTDPHPGTLTPLSALNHVNLKTAVDWQRCRQLLDRSWFSTASHFTQEVTNAVAANTCG